MQRFVRTTMTALLALGLLTTSGLAQTPQAENSTAAAKPAEEGKDYRLLFLIKEMDEGKVVNSRSYSTIYSTSSGGGGLSSIRTGLRIPRETENGQYSYLDVGVNIDCRQMRPLRQQNGETLRLIVSAEVSAVQTDPAANSHTPPIIAQNKWNADVVVTLGKPTVLFQSDDVRSKRTTQVELTAVPVK